jgi:hypothetical protein
MRSYPNLGALGALFWLCLACHGPVRAADGDDCNDNPFLRHLPGGCEQFLPEAPDRNAGRVRIVREVGGRQVLIVARTGPTATVEVWEAEIGATDRDAPSGVWSIPRVELLRLRDDLLVASFHLRFAPGRSDLSPGGEALIEEYLALINSRAERLRRLEVVGHTDIVPTVPGKQYDVINQRAPEWCRNTPSVYDGRPVASDANECIGLLRLDRFMGVVSRYAEGLAGNGNAIVRYSPSFFLDDVNAELDGRLHAALELTETVAALKGELGLEAYDYSDLGQVQEQRARFSAGEHRFSPADMSRLEPFRAIVAIATFE